MKFFWKIIFISALMSFLIIGLGNAKAYQRANNSGNNYLEKGDFDKAIKKYQEANLKKSAEPGIIYNLGKGFYGKNDYEKATVFFDQAAELAEDPNLKADSYFNAGNSYLAMKKPDKAVESYVNSLNYRDKDNDTLSNLQKALMMLQQQQQQQQQNQDQQDDKKDDKDKQQNQQQQQQQEKKDDKKEEKDKNQQQQQQQQKQEEEKQKQQQAKKEENKDDKKDGNKMILQALDEMEKETQKDRKKREIDGSKKIEKPW